MRRKRITHKPIEPDEIFLDSSNLPGMNTGRLEGQLDRPLAQRAMYGFAAVALVALLLLSVRAGYLQVAQGNILRERSENNTFRSIPIFAERGLIFDRNHTPLVWNEEAGRAYIEQGGFSHVLGYLGLPNAEELGDHYSRQLVGRAGVERAYDRILSGAVGIKIVETDALGEVVSEGVIEPASPGSALSLTVDARIQEELYRIIERTAAERGFEGGAGVIMDVRTGELIALVSYPEYRSQVLARGEDAAQIADWNDDARKPFLHRAIAGIYTPGSIIKPFVALAALAEGVISPEKEIYSPGHIDVLNPYDPDDFTRFNDWKAHGYVNMRRALAVSSNVYFYEVGGGYGSQQGLGISRLKDYLSLFGFGAPTGLALAGEEYGVVPSPAWKAEVFDGEDWRIGDTYFTAIGQFGFGVTALQMARAVAAIASSGAMVTPHVFLDVARERSTVGARDFLDVSEKDEPVSGGDAVRLPFSGKDIAVVKEGMRLAVREGTAAGLNTPAVEVAAKTGTAELGVSKQKVNSWAIGFWPYQQSRYAFAVVMEKGSRTNVIGGVSVMRTLFDRMQTIAPEYLAP